METENTEKYIANYTLEKIYDLVGRKDYSSTITFRPNSLSARQYGNTLTLVFQYTQQERKELESNIKNGNIGKHGYAKARCLLFDLPDDKRNSIEKVGINTKDISNITWYAGTKPQNTYGSTEKRETQTMIIGQEVSTYNNCLQWIYNTLKLYKEKGIGLCPEEINRYLAYKLIIEPAEVTKEESSMIYNENDIINDDIAYVYLGFKCLTLAITKEEFGKYMKLWQEHYSKRIAILERELGISIEKLKEKEPEKAEFLINAVCSFHEKRYNNIGKFPLYLDLEGFLHIYLRHVEDLQFDSKFTQKDKFQLYIKDIEIVMAHVLHEINSDYQVFKTEHPDKRYGKYGLQSRYYLGDYYTVFVNENGSIGSFFKKHNL